MNILTFDVETTHRSKPNGGYTPLPYYDNKLVSIGWKVNDDVTKYAFVHHDGHPADLDKIQEFREDLQLADVVVGHNVKFDLNWIRECGFDYDGHVYDTMVAEYLLARARKFPLSLEALAQRYEVTEKKKDLTADYLKSGKTFAQIPWEIVLEYGIADVEATWEVAQKQVTEKYMTTWEELYSV